MLVLGPNVGNQRILAGSKLCFAASSILENKFHDCNIEDVFELKESVLIVVMSLLEGNTLPRISEVLLETLDTDVLVCYLLALELFFFLPICFIFLCCSRIQKKKKFAASRFQICLKLRLMCFFFISISLTKCWKNQNIPYILVFLWFFLKIREMIDLHGVASANLDYNPQKLRSRKVIERIRERAEGNKFSNEFPLVVLFIQFTLLWELFFLTFVFFHSLFFWIPFCLFVSLFFDFEKDVQDVVAQVFDSDDRMMALSLGLLFYFLTNQLMDRSSDFAASPSCASLRSRVPLFDAASGSVEIVRNKTVERVWRVFAYL